MLRLSTANWFSFSDAEGEESSSSSTDEGCSGSSDECCVGATSSETKSVSLGATVLLAAKALTIPLSQALDTSYKTFCQ